MITITNPPATEKDPRVIKRTTEASDPYDAEIVTVQGEFARVNVTTGEDWALIRLLRHGIDYHAPATGNGLLVHCHLLQR